MPKTLRLISSTIFKSLGPDEACLLDTNHWNFFALNKTGQFIVEKLVQGCTLNQLVDSLAEHFALLPNDCRTDVELFIKELSEAELLVNEKI